MALFYIIDARRIGTLIYRLNFETKSHDFHVYRYSYVATFSECHFFHHRSLKNIHWGHMHTVLYVYTSMWHGAMVILNILNGKQFVFFHFRVLENCFGLHSILFIYVNIQYIACMQFIVTTSTRKFDEKWIWKYKKLLLFTQRIWISHVWYGKRPLQCARQVPTTGEKCKRFILKARKTNLMDGWAK